jgi:hypothetical protein
MRDAFSVLSKSISFHKKKNKKIFLSKIQFYFKLHIVKSLKKKLHKKNTRYDLASLNTKTQEK